MRLFTHERRWEFLGYSHEGSWQTDFRIEDVLSREGSSPKTTFWRLNCLAVEGLTFWTGSGACLGPIRVVPLLRSLLQSPNCWRQGSREYVVVQNRLIRTEAWLQAPCCGESRAVHGYTRFFDVRESPHFAQPVITQPCGLIEINSYECPWSHTRCVEPVFSCGP